MKARLLCAAVLGLSMILTACGGSQGSTPGTTTTSSATGSNVSLVLGDAPPAGVSVLSFEVTVTKALLEPGDVPVVTAPVKVEVSRLETETAFLNTANVPAGSYTGINVTFANAEITIQNNSGAAIGTCGVGQICEINPPLPAAAVSFSGAPFPLTISAGTPMGLALDLNLANSIQSDLSINPSISLTQLATKQSGEMEDVDEIVGQVTAKDTAKNTFTIQIGTQGKSQTFSVDSSTEFSDFDKAGALNTFAGVAIGQIVKVNAKLMPDGTMLAHSVELAEADKEGELEGIVTSVVDATHFNIVMHDEEPDNAAASVGQPITVTVQSGATFSVDAEDLSLPSGLTFAGTADMIAGQEVQIHPLSVGSGAASTDRVRLRLSHVTGRISAISGATLTLDTLPAIFTSANPSITNLDVATQSKTVFQNVSGLTGLKVGDTVSAGGPLFKTSGNPQMVAKRVRKR